MPRRRLIPKCWKPCAPFPDGRKCREPACGGASARRAWEEAKEKVARILGAEPGEVIFTSGGTEANNLAVFGLAGIDQAPGHVVSSPIEHPAVAEAVGSARGREIPRGPAAGQ